MQACVQRRRQRRDAMLSPALMDITAATMVGIPAASPTMANIIIAATSQIPDTADPFPMVIAPASGECSDEPSVARTDLRGHWRILLEGRGKIPRLLPGASQVTSRGEGISAIVRALGAFTPADPCDHCAKRAPVSCVIVSLPSRR